MFLNSPHYLRNWILIVCCTCVVVGCRTIDRADKGAINSNISDEQFIDTAISLVDCLGNNSPATVEAKYREARELLVDPALTEFDQEIMREELPEALRVHRVQSFEVDRSGTCLTRFDAHGVVVVEVPGKRAVSATGRNITNDRMIFYVKMLATEPNSIRVTDLRLRHYTNESSRCSRKNDLP